MRRPVLSPPAALAELAVVVSPLAAALLILGAIAFFCLMWGASK